METLALESSYSHSCMDIDMWIVCCMMGSCHLAGIPASFHCTCSCIVLELEIGTGCAIALVSGSSALRSVACSVAFPDVDCFSQCTVVASIGSLGSDFSSIPIS